MFGRAMYCTAMAAALLGGALSSVAAHAQGAFFTGLGDLPGGDFRSEVSDVSADGRVIVGKSRTGATETEAFRWTQQSGMVRIGNAGETMGATAVSADGSTVVGYSGSGVTRPFKWSASQGIEMLPGYAGLVNESAHGISADGQTIVGWAVNDSGSGNGLRWTAAGVENLSSAVGLSNFAMTGLSADGSTLLGGNRSAEKGFVLNAAQGLQYLTATFPYEAKPTRPNAASADGSVVVGEIYDSGPFRWTAATGVVRLEGPVQFYSAVATDVSADGSIVVGRESAGSISPAWIWDAAHGIRDLKQVLIDDYGLGASLADWTSLLSINVAVSADGRTIVGSGTNSRGLEAFVAFLGAPVPEPSSLALVCMAFAPLLRSCARKRNAPVCDRRSTTACALCRWRAPGH